MNRTRFLVSIFVGVLAIVFIASCSGKEDKPAKRPNIIFLLTDDQRNDTLGCAGNPTVKTPNIDKLAADGVRFENCFVTTAICAASRASIFTGLMERTHGYTFGKPAVLEKYTSTSYPALLKQAGYRTGFIGKYGCLMEKDDDIFDFKKVVGGPGYFKQPDGSVLESTEVIGNIAKDFVDTDDNRPFCLSVSFRASHAVDGNHEPGKGHYPYPLGLSEFYEDQQMPLPNLNDPKYFDTLPEYLQTSMNRERFHWRWDTPEKYQTNMRAYYRMITGIDDVVGHLVKQLEAKGLADNTVIIYTADNGYYMGDRGFAGKWSHFEQSLRIPLIVYDPRLPKGQRGRVVEQTALNIDFAPTMLELAEVEIPENYEGRSLNPVVTDDTAKISDWRKEFFCEHLMDNPIIPKWEGVRTERYKYARYFEQVPVYEFLHDLKTDPTEFTNLVTNPDYKEVLAKMRSKVDTFAKENPRILLAENLQCEYKVKPLGIDVEKPRLGWTFKSEVRGQKQTAYQVIVSSSFKNAMDGKGDIWDSGKVSGNSNQVVYGGDPLKSATVYHWRVRFWDKDGKETRWCKPSTFETGLMKQSDWTAKWINDGKKNPTAEEDLFKFDPAPLFRKDFDSPKPIEKARLYITGLGYYEASLNGHRVGDHMLDPGWTNYSERVYYSTYDVTRQLRKGENCLGVTLGNGWYNPMPLRMWGHVNLRDRLPIGRPRLIAQLDITYRDGSKQSVVSDESWKVTQGPIVRNSLYLGEIYDASKEIPDWNKPGFDDLLWSNAAPAEEELGKLVAQPLEPIRVTATVKPVKITEPEEGVYVVDMGQNFSGLASFKFNLKKGTKVNIRYGELLHKDGTLNPMTSVCGQIKRKRNDDLESHPGVAWQNDVYFAKGGGLETYTPRFSWHAFRYLEITGIDAKPTLDMVVGHRLNSDVKRVGSFSCSNEMFNSIQKICDWTFLSNIFSVQSDCPHRERFGYGGDLVNTNETFICNYDMSSFYAKAVTDWDDGKLKDGMLTDTAPSVGIQYCGVGWAMAHPHTQLKLYQYYGDKRIIQQQYETAKQWLGLVTESNPSNIVSNGLSDHETLSRKSTAPKYRIELLAGGVVVASKSGLASPDGSKFVKADLTYKSGSDVMVDPNVGMPLEVRLLAEYTQEYDQVDFDKVELTNDLPNYVVTFKEPSYVLEFSDRNYVAPGMEFGFVTKKADRKFDFTYSYPDANEPDILIGKNLSSVVPIVNGGFEDTQMVNGWSVDEVSGWSEGWYDLNAANPDKWVGLGEGMELNCGVYDPNGIYNGKAPEGENVSYVECDRGYISGLSQVLADALLPNTKYTLSVEVGNPSIHRRRAPMVTPLYYQSVKMLEKMAGILGYQEDAEKYAALSTEIEKAYNEKYFNPETGRCSPGTQSSQSFALFSDLIADDKRPAAVKYLLDDISEHDGHLTTGIFGTRYMLETLSREGYGQVAYDIVNQKTFPGWGHMLDNGATTLWEHWAYSDNTFSHNHPMFGSVSQWFYNWLGGIQADPDAVGFDRIIIRPLIPADLNWVNSSYDSVRGKVTSNWKKTGDSLVMDIVIPASAVATVYVPCDSPEGIKESGKPAGQAVGIEFVRYENNAAIYKVQSGTYQFTVPN